MREIPSRHRYDEYLCTASRQGAAAAAAAAVWYTPEYVVSGISGVW